jgi:hypothetical protein
VVQCSSRCLDLRGWALLFAHARFGRFVPGAPSPRAGFRRTWDRASASYAVTPLSALDADPPRALFSYWRLKSLHRTRPDL